MTCRLDLNAPYWPGRHLTNISHKAEPIALRSVVAQPLLLRNDFARQLEHLLARLPVLRSSGQTPRELAATAQAHLSSLDGAALAAQVPADVVAAYYRVRFGGCRLDKNEIESIEQALSALNAAVRQKVSGRSAGK